jgi:hypothetical protein
MLIRQKTDALETTEMPTPILASIFTALGGLIVIATILVVVVSYPKDEKIMAVPTVLIIGGSGGFTALVFFGIAQVLRSIALIEHHASREKNEAILHSLHRIEGLFETRSKNPRGKPRGIHGNNPKSICPLCNT